MLLPFKAGYDITLLDVLRLVSITPDTYVLGTGTGQTFNLSAQFTGRVGGHLFVWSVLVGTLTTIGSTTVSTDSITGVTTVSAVATINDPTNNKFQLTMDSGRSTQLTWTVSYIREIRSDVGNLTANKNVMLWQFQPTVWVAANLLNADGHAPSFAYYFRWDYAPRPPYTAVVEKNTGSGWTVASTTTILGVGHGITYGYQSDVNPQNVVLRVSLYAGTVLLFQNYYSVPSTNISVAANGESLLGSMIPSVNANLSALTVMPSRTYSFLISQTATDDEPVGSLVPNTNINFASFTTTPSRTYNTLTVINTTDDEPVGSLVPNVNVLLASSTTISRTLSGGSILG